jgi:cysteine synthase
MKAANILETIGNTPHVRLNRLFGTSAEVWIKQERANPGGSIKDRIASRHRATPELAWRWSPRSRATG